jgi:magnesium transporter
MISRVYECENYVWLDVTHPTQTELLEIGQKYGLHPDMLEDFLEPHHLPKTEKWRGVRFIMLRCFDERAGLEAQTIRDLSRKLAIFIGGNYVLTLHRAEMPFFERFKTEWTQSPENEYDRRPQALAAEIMRAVADSYVRTLETAENVIDGFERKIFDNEKHPFTFKEFYELKQHSSVVKSLLRMQADIAVKLQGEYPDFQHCFKSLEESVANHLYRAAAITENLANILNIYLSISAHNTNEIMRVLTMLSVFFLPLTFIVGIYGMNFDHMPELHVWWGYPMTWALMILVVAGIYGYFKRKRWL